MNPFSLPEGVRVAGATPVDQDRYLAADITARNNITAEGRAHPGCLCYVESDQELYIYIGITWVKVMSDLTGDAVDVTYDNSISGLEAINVQSAIDELQSSSGGLADGTYSFSTSTTVSDPGSGKVRFNSATPANVTNIIISQTTDSGTDALFYFDGLGVNDKILIQRKDDSSSFITGVLTGTPTDNGDWWEIPITIISSGTLPQNNKDVLVAIRYVTIPATVHNGQLTVSGTGVLGGSGIFTANQSGNSTIDITHDSVPRGNTSTSENPSHGGSFTVIGLVGTSVEGHVTSIQTKTITLPSAASSSNYYLSSATHNASNVVLNVTGASAVNLNAANASTAGVVTTGTQTFAGTKTFTSTINSNVNGTLFKTVAASGTGDLLYGSMADNDYFRIRIGGSTNAGYVELATSDDSDEPIYVRQYSGVFTTLTRTATLLDGSGNTSFPGTISASQGNSSQWDQAYDNYITGISIGGTTTKTITLTQRDGGTISDTFTDNNTDTNYYLTGLSYAATTSILTATVSGANNPTVDLSNKIYADALAVTGNGTANVSYLRSDGDGTFTWATPPNTNTQNIFTSSWVDSGANALLRLTKSGASSGTQDIVLVAGTSMTLTPSGSNLTFTHDNVSISTTTSSSSPNFGGSFTTLSSVSRNLQGHVEGYNTKTVTLPSLNSSNTQLLYNNNGNIDGFGAKNTYDVDFGLPIVLEPKSSHPNAGKIGTIVYDSTASEVNRLNYIVKSTCGIGTYVPVDGCTVFNNQIATATESIWWSYGASTFFSLTQNIIISIDELPNGIEGTILVQQDATGGRSVSVINTLSLSQVVIGPVTSVNTASSKYSSITYKRINDRLILVYGHES